MKLFNIVSYFTSKIIFFLIWIIMSNRITSSSEYSTSPKKISEIPEVENESDDYDDVEY